MESIIVSMALMLNIVNSVESMNTMRTELYEYEYEYNGEIYTYIASCEEHPDAYIIVNDEKIYINK